MDAIEEHLGVRIEADLGRTAKRRGEYASMPHNPGWAIYRGHSVRSGDRVVRYSAREQRSVILRELDVPKEHIVNLARVREEPGWSFLAGSAFYGIVELHLALDRKKPVFLRRRPDNPFDAHAIEVYFGEFMVGHVGVETAEEYAPVLDELGILACEVRHLLNPRVHDKNDLAFRLPDLEVLRAMVLARNL